MPVGNPKRAACRPKCSLLSWSGSASWRSDGHRCGTARHAGGAPVHIRGAGHDAAHTLRIVGLVLSLHIAGMFAFAPGLGWLTDRLGRRPVILVGIALLLAACAVAGSAGHQPARLAAALAMLGLGWSATIVAGSTLLSESVSGDLRVAVQGLADLTMGLAGAAAGAISGVILERWGYPMLTLLAALATGPLVVLVALKTTTEFRTLSPASATTLRRSWAWERGRPSASAVTSPKVSMPSSIFDMAT